jgi:hypothetical protein
MTPAEQLTLALGGRWNASAQRGRARCPLCPPEKPRTLVISVGSKVPILLHDFRQHDPQPIIEQLRVMGLWPERERREYTRDQRAEYRNRMRDLADARLWRVAALAMADESLIQTDSTDPSRAELTRLQTILGDDSLLVSEYRVWRVNDPELTAAMVEAGHCNRQRTQTALAKSLVSWGEHDARE